MLAGRRPGPLDTASRSPHAAAGACARLVNHRGLQAGLRIDSAAWLRASIAAGEEASAKTAPLGPARGLRGLRCSHASHRTGSSVNAHYSLSFLTPGLADDVRGIARSLPPRPRPISAADRRVGDGTAPGTPHHATLSSSPHPQATRRTVHRHLSPPLPPRRCPNRPSPAHFRPRQPLRPTPNCARRSSSRPPPFGTL